ncbi:hypothetical protein NM688_g6548 [Phlebia brevispora]|uniref:Uncharacterized protein n=1 Tax=Phlebia brevispora TaxID=194682 RepID=A0ACC1SES5_9APHY|nr:hypothetical protein NM688_g6548 [Phlebia brevispora]
MDQLASDTLRRQLLNASTSSCNDAAISYSADGSWSLYAFCGLSNASMQTNVRKMGASLHDTDRISTLLTHSHRLVAGPSAIRFRLRSQSLVPCLARPTLGSIFLRIEHGAPDDPGLSYTAERLSGPHEG